MGRRLMETTGLDDMDHLAVIGAEMVSRASLANKLGLSRQNAPSWMTDAPNLGVSTPAEELDYLPLEPFDFTNGGAVAVDIDDQLSALPQRPFRGERVVMSAIKITAAGVLTDILFAITIAPAMYVGAVQVGSFDKLSV